MERLRFFLLLVLIPLSEAAVQAEEKTMQTTETLLLDDFVRKDGISSWGTPWEGFTDQVMGGVSDIRIDYGMEDEVSFLRMRGNVSTKNNGGFIQVRLKLGRDGGTMDASAYEGLRLRVRGTGSGYYVHIRTTRTVFPWSYYAQAFEVTDGWNEVELPFKDFQPENVLSSGVNSSKLVSLAVVAAKKDFFADVQVSKVELY
jgi:hypothetical protein